MMDIITGRVGAARLSRLPRFLHLGRIRDFRGNRVGLEVLARTLPKFLNLGRNQESLAKIVPHTISPYDS